MKYLFIHFTSKDSIAVVPLSFASKILTADRIYRRKNCVQSHVKDSRIIIQVLVTRQNTNTDYLRTIEQFVRGCTNFRRSSRPATRITRMKN